MLGSHTTRIRLQYIMRSTQSAALLNDISQTLTLIATKDSVEGPWQGPIQEPLSCHPLLIMVRALLKK